ncbi:hypothetical protein ACFL4T_08155 [candidate division KSB1 bacterium]
MRKPKSKCSKYLAVGILGAIGGGITMAYATKAVPDFMSCCMKKMMEKMNESGCEPPAG